MFRGDAVAVAYDRRKTFLEKGLTSKVDCDIIKTTKGNDIMTEREKRIMEILEMLNKRENPTWEDETEKYYLEKELAEIRAKRG